MAEMAAYSRDVGLVGRSGEASEVGALISGGLRLKDEQGREEVVQTWGAPWGSGLRNWEKAHVAGAWR